MEQNKFLSVIEALGEVIINRDVEISLLQYENEKLKKKIEAIEDHVESYVNNASKKEFL